MRIAKPDILIVPRQAHGEHSFFFVGSHGHLATMRPGNLAHNIQSQAEPRPAVIAVTLPESPMHVRLAGDEADITIEVLVCCVVG